MKACRIDDCPSAVVAREMCRKHYTRWKRTGDPTAARAKLPNHAYVTCTVEGCDKPHVTKGLCEMHRWRQRYQGDPGEATERQVGRPGSPKAPCILDGCDRPGRSRAGYCKLHDARIRRFGHTGPAGLMVRENGTGHINSDGYVRLTLADGRRVLEHVHVMEQLLGRRLLPGETVHHVYGQRSDNRTNGPLDERFRSGNLELWSSAQPAGQRVADKIEFAVEILREYAPHLLSEEGVLHVDAR